jgi:hypothetical protein
LNHSAALRESLSINLHCTGSKGGYEPAVFTQLSGKNLDYHSKSGFDAEEVLVNRFKDVNLTNDSIGLAIQVLFGFSYVNFAEKQIKTFRCSNLAVLIYTEGFPTKDEIEIPRTPVNVVELFFDPYHRASRGTAAEQKSSPLRSEIIFMLNDSLNPKSRIWDPVTLGNLVSIGNNQWTQVGIDY